MATNTQHLKLLKKDVATDGHETFNIETMLNENWDKIDSGVKAVKEKVDGIDISSFPTKQDLTSHADKTATTGEKGHVQLSNVVSADQTTAITPKGVNDALQGVNETINTKADQSAVDAINTALTKKADQTAVDAINTALTKKADQTAVDTINTALTKKADQTAVDTINTTLTKKADQTAVDTINTNVEANKTAIKEINDTRMLKMLKTNIDPEGIFTTVTYKRKSDNTTYCVSTLSGGVTPLYTTRTEQYYNAAGTSVIATHVYSLSYDDDENLISEV